MSDTYLVVNLVLPVVAVAIGFVGLWYSRRL